MRILITLLIAINSGICSGQVSYSEHQVEQLFKLGKVWGYLKYYHPQITKGKYDWDKELLEQIPKVLESKTNQVANKLLFEWAISIGKVPKQIQYEIAEEVKLRPPTKWIEDNEALGTDLSEFLTTLKSVKRGKKSHYVKYEGSHSSFTEEKAYAEFEYEDKGILLLGLFRFWNIIEYFYPYRYLTNDWDSVLRTYIPRFLNCTNSLDYKLQIKRLAKELNDTHANVYDDELVEYFGKFSPPIDVRCIDGKYVIYRLLPGFEHAYGLEVGDVIQEVEGEPIRDRISNLTQYVPASNPVIEEFGAIQMALRTNQESVSIALSVDRTTKVRTYKVDELKPHWLQKNSNDILDDIGYIYLGSVDIGTLDSIFNQFSEKKGLIVDMRCYPSYYMYDLLNYISPNYDEFIKGTIGSITMPGLFTFSPITMKVTANENYFKGKVVVLVDELTLSQSESYAMAFRVNPNTTIIGSTSAGADGDVVPIILPGDVTVAMTSWGVYYPDGGETQGIGIIPDIRIRPTIKGLREGKDELIEYAIKYINEEN